MTIAELRKVAEAATPGEWNDKPASEEWIANSENNCRHVRTFSPARALKLLAVVEAAQEMRATLLRNPDSEGGIFRSERELTAFDRAIEELGK